nr:hypothetical protein CFP56_79630 [Quercus suber]
MLLSTSTNAGRAKHRRSGHPAVQALRSHLFASSLREDRILMPISQTILKSEELPLSLITAKGGLVYYATASPRSSLRIKPGPSTSFVYLAHIVKMLPSLPLAQSTDDAKLSQSTSNRAAFHPRTCVCSRAILLAGFPPVENEEVYI